MISNRTGFALLLAVLVLASPAVAHRRHCNIATHRVTGKNSLFSLICRCDGNPEMLGRAIRFLDPKKPDTIAQDKLTVRCIEHRKNHMARVCAHRGGNAYQHVAARVLSHCMRIKPRNPKPSENKPFTFDRSKCVAEFRELDVARVEALLVCACTQRPGYLVHPGVIQFVTDLSPNGAAAEQKLLKRCTNEFIPSLSQSCSAMPKRFDLRSAQKFNTCCKRLRTRFPNAKHKCQAIVPDDVDTLGLTFVNPAGTR